MAAVAEMEAETETYVDAVRDALHALGADPKCLIDVKLFEVMAEGHFLGLGPFDAAKAVVAAMRARAAADAWANDEDFRPALLDCARM